MTKTAVITGINSTVGKALHSALKHEGWRIVSFSRHAPVDVESYPIDLLDAESLNLDRFEEKIDAVFHLAALMPSHTPKHMSDFFSANATATLKLVESATKKQVKNFVYASSVSVIGQPLESPQNENHPLNPIHDYSIGKLGGELACLTGANAGMTVSCLRLASIYGPGMSDNTVLPRFVKMALSQGSIALYGTGQRAQDFVHVNDIALAMRLAAQCSESGVFCIGAGKSTTMHELAQEISALIPGTDIVFTKEPDPQEGIIWHADISKARDILGYKPTITLKEGLREYLKAQVI